MKETMAFRLMKQGYIQGKKEGKKEGYKEGYIQGYNEECKKIVKKNIIIILKRFHKRVPKDIQNSVNSYSDLIALESLFQRA
ncbi:MAG: hypothetical protein LBP59_04680, partial [Planctomycetaceae bacterium]|nr:hypothetical protein [Planctomycetaceae bacterium]